MIVDNKFFNKPEVYIPNNTDVGAQPVGNQSVKSDLDVIIEKYERVLLLDALGVTLYNELQTALKNISTAAQKWKDLVQGADYTINNQVYRWDGLQGYNNDSLIAYFIYTQYLVNDELTYTTTGMVRNEASNAITAPFNTKYVRAWNNFTQMYQADLYRYSNRCYNFYKRNNWYLSYWESLEVYRNINVNVKASLWQFLNDSNTLDATAFPDFQFKVYAPCNRFGI